MKKAFSLIALSSLFLIMVLFSFSQQAPSYDELRYRPLKGIKELMVGVENLTDAAADIQLTRERIQTVTELMLQREGLRIVRSGHAYLYVNILIMKRAYSVSVELREPVTLDRDPSISCFASTWDTQRVGTHGNSADWVIQALRESIEEFLNSYYLANPKR